MDTAERPAQAPIITVLRCDFVPEPDRSRFGDTELRTAEHVRRAAAVLGWTPQIRVVDVLAGELPAADDDSDLYVTTGSATDPDSALPWVRALREWMPRALAGGARIYGICFGHQLLAHALGADVGRAADWEVGRVPMRRRLWLPVGGATRPPQAYPTPAQDAPPAMVALLESHQDEVRALPRGAQLLLEGEACRLQGYVVAGLPGGGAAVGVQGHPEFETEQVSALYRRRTERLGEARVEAACASAALPNDGIVWSAEVLAFLLGDRFAADLAGVPEPCRH